MEAISSFPRPTDLRQLQRFLGLINFYRRFLPAIAGILKPLTDLLRGAPKKLLWSSDADAAFTKAKAALVVAVPLSHPAPGAVLSLAVDASDTHVGGVLQQLQGRAWQPLAFFSKKLSPTHVRYSTFDRELLAAFSAVRHFRFLLEGRRLEELQHTLCNRTPPPADHHNRPGPLKLPEELMLTRYVLVRRDGAQPPLSPMYDGPYLVLERSLRFFRLQVGTRQDTVSTLRLKPCRSPPDVQPAVPLRRGRPPTSPAAA